MVKITLTPFAVVVECDQCVLSNRYDELWFRGRKLSGRMVLARMGDTIPALEVVDADLEKRGWLLSTLPGAVGYTVKEHLCEACARGATRYVDPLELITEW